MDNETIKKNILKIREEMNLTQGEFADLVGISRNAFRAIERGETKIFNDNISAIAAASGRSAEEVVLGYKPIENADQVLREAKSAFGAEMNEVVQRYEDLLRQKDEKIEDLKKQVELLEEINGMLKRQSEKGNSEKDC